MRSPPTWQMSRKVGTLGGGGGGLWVSAGCTPYVGLGHVVRFSPVVQEVYTCTTDDRDRVIDDVLEHRHSQRQAGFVFNIVFHLGWAES